jgi:hypothetical protein
VLTTMGTVSPSAATKAATRRVPLGDGFANIARAVDRLRGGRGRPHTSSPPRCRMCSLTITSTPRNG